METLCSHLLTRPDLSQGDWARVLGLSPSYLSQLLNGRRRPSDDMKQLISLRTGGAVPVSAWFEAAPSAEDAA